MGKLFAITISFSANLLILFLSRLRSGDLRLLPFLLRLLPRRRHRTRARAP